MTQNTDQTSVPQTHQPESITESEEVRELKHSIRTHLLIMAGPSQQLCAFLVKTVDFIEDTDLPRRKTEMLGLAFNIIEAIGIHVQKHIDTQASKAVEQGRELPQSVKNRGNEILVVIGKSRSISDKIAAKGAVLKAMAEAMDALGVFMKATYPTIFDSKGNPLNNRYETGLVAQPLQAPSDES